MSHIFHMFTAALPAMVNAISKKEGTMKKILSIALAAVLAFSAVPTFAERPELNVPTMEDVESIQAYLDGTIYGNHLVQVDVTYKEGVDLSGITPESYILEDRGTVTPDFGKVAIGDVTVEGQVVSIEIPMVTAATGNNDLIYTGVAAGARQRNSFGASVTGPWYRDPEGQIFFGKEDTDEYKANWSGMGYWTRPTLELKLRHIGETEESAACMADEKGQFVEGGLWLPQIDSQFADWQTFEEAGIEIPTTANKEVVTDGTGDDFIRGIFFVPENYDPAKGIVFIEQGNGIVYWQLNDGSNNYLTAAYFDTASTSWANTGAIVVQIDDRSNAGPCDDATGYKEYYDYCLDDVRIMKYFIETYAITGPVVIQGNSRGTSASNRIIKALAGCKYHIWEGRRDKEGQYEVDMALDKEEFPFVIDCYICQNGSFLGASDEDTKAIIDTGLKAWIFDGEQDTNNIEAVQKWIDLGGDPEKVRLTGYPSNIYYYWGESDHSTTRINGWYFADEPFYGPDVTVDPATGALVYGEKLADGDKYTLPARGNKVGTSKEGYEYTIYEDSFHTWALQ